VVRPHEEYLRLARTEVARREAYRELFKAHLDPEAVEEIRQSTHGNFALENERFKKQIEKALGRPRQEERDDAS
jgi:putative transposase